MIACLSGVPNAVDVHKRTCSRNIKSERLIQLNKGNYHSIKKYGIHDNRVAIKASWVF